MSPQARRSFFKTSSITSAGLAALAISSNTSTPVIAAPNEISYGVVTPDSKQWQDLRQGTNLRWIGTPSRIAFPRNTEEVITELNTVINLGLRPTVRSGGHCYEDFVSNNDISAIIDTSAMSYVKWDDERQAFEVGAGTQLGHVYQLLYKQWGVYVPAGNCPTVAAGGHIACGGYGSMNRRDGLVVDYLQAVEVVHVNADGTISASTGTRDPHDPHHELWWGHTGGGGGNFGIVTRYWLRTPNLSTYTPESALPTPPSQVIVSTVAWPWELIDESKFTQLLSNHGSWHEKYADAGTPEAGLFSQLKLNHKSTGYITMDTIVDAGVSDAEGVLDRYIATLAENVGQPEIRQRRTVPWMQATQWTGFTGPDSTRRFDGKSAYLRRTWTTEAIKGAYKSLANTEKKLSGALLMIASYGGAVNRVSPTDTVVPQRDSIIKFQVVSIWDNKSDDDINIQWTRKTYSTMFASTGGVPIPNDNTDGAFVGYADTDLDDPTLNTSGWSAHALYYKDNLKRLINVKRKYDPNNIFKHSQSLPVA